MTDRQKPKSNRTRNDNRRNGKAFKKGGSRGSQPVSLDPVQKVLLGQGAFRTWKPVGAEPSTQR
jgi:hypothetical protein